MDNIKYAQDFEQIAGLSNKLQTVCKLAINSFDNSRSELQTVLYIMQDYISDIKSITDIIV